MASFRSEYLWWTLAAGLIFGSAALILAPAIGLEISNAFGNREGRVTWLTLFVGVFLLGSLFWWLLMPRLHRVSPERGAIAGILIAFFSYPVVLAFAEIFQRDWGEAPMFSERLNQVLWITGLTLMTTGFVACLIMALIGMAASWALARFHPLTAAGVNQAAPRQRSAFVRGSQKIAGAVAFALLAFLIGSFTWLTLIPIDVEGLIPAETSSEPARSYTQAIAAFETIQAEEAAMPLHQRCPSRLLTHGRKVERVVVYFHGLTSCPAQGEDLADKLYALGYNVYLPRMFGHGEADPDTLSLADLTAEHLVELADRSVDLAQGLGEEVVVTGLSAGGTIAAWTAQYRADADLALPISPFLGPYVVPPWATHAATNLVLMLPDMMFLWNPLEPVTAPETDYVFPRPSIHTLAQVMRLGRIVFASADKIPPATGHIGMLLNEADVAVNNDLARQLVSLWQGQGREVNIEVLSFSRHLPHDLINPREIYGDPELVYAILVEMMNEGAQ